MCMKGGREICSAGKADGRSNFLNVHDGLYKHASGFVQACLTNEFVYRSPGLGLEYAGQAFS